jgi:hypothetical protein
MAAKKVKVPAAWNAKPVTQRGGGSGGVRKPTKPYAKPPAKPAAEKPARWDAKTNLDKLKEAAKTQPTRPAPRPGAKPTGSIGARPMGTADVGQKGPVGSLGQRTGMSVKPTPTPKPTPTAAPKPTGNNPFISGKPNPNAAMSGVKGAVRALKGGKGLLGPVSTAAAIVPTAMSVFNPKDNIITRLGKLGSSIEKAIPGGGAKPRPVKPNKPGVSNIPPSEGTGRGGPSDVRKNQTQTSTRKPSTPAPTRNGGGGSAPSAPRSSSAPVRRPSPSPAVSKQTGDKAKDMETWRKANPTLAKALDERQAKKQSGSALKISNQFDTKSDVYSPSTKVDGSKLDTSKIDQKKVSEYKRRKDRYYS